jgi:hypothetical protein
VHAEARIEDEAAVEPAAGDRVVNAGAGWLGADPFGKNGLQSEWVAVVVGGAADQDVVVCAAIEKIASQAAKSRYRAGEAHRGRSSGLVSASGSTGKMPVVLHFSGNVAGGLLGDRQSAGG